MEIKNMDLVTYQNEDERENTFKDCILMLLENWIEYNDERVQYKDALTLCRDIIKVFDSDCEFYVDDVSWNIIREYIKEYEYANECKFEL